jgi:tetratricopeptide (TPR) repeat protein
MSNYISPYSLQLMGRSGQDKVLYRDYLQGRSLVHDVTSSVDQVRCSISESSREMIANSEQLHEMGYQLVASAIGDLAEGVGEGFEEVSWQLGEVSTGIQELTAKFDWGFSQLIAGIGRVNDSLEELIAVAKTPAETWAYEQYEIARDAIRRELFPEAVEALQRAINGHGDQVGYKLEYRFHYTLGILFLGNLKNTDPDILDLAKAETSFLTAARYAKTDYPNEASVALTAAGWAAYCQDKLTDAEKYTRQALDIPAEVQPSHGEPFYQLSKIQMLTDRPKEATPNLRCAIDLDPQYSVKAAADPDFLRHQPDLNALIEDRRSAAEKAASQAIEEAKQQLARLKEWGLESTSPTEWSSLQQRLKKAEEGFSTGTFFGFLDASSAAKKLSGAAKDLLQKQRPALQDRLRNGLRRLHEFETGFGPRAHACWSQGYFQAADRLAKLESLGSDVRIYDEYVTKAAGLKETAQLFRDAALECRNTITKRIAQRKLLGRAIGALIGLAIALIPSVILASITFPRSDNAQWTYFFFLMLVAGTAGALVPRKKEIEKQRTFPLQFGTEPPLYVFDGAESDPASVSAQSSRSQAVGVQNKAS